MNVEIEAEAALFPEKEYINGIAVAVQVEKRYGHWSSPHSYNINGGESISGDTLTPFFKGQAAERLKMF